MAQEKIICEVNGQLVSGSIDRNQVKMAKGSPTNAVFYPEIELRPDPVPWRPEHLPGPLASDQGLGSEDHSRITSLRSFALETVEEVSNIWAKRAALLGLPNWRQGRQPPKQPSQQIMAWHPQKQQLAVANGPNVVEVYNLEPSRASHQTRGVESPKPVIHLQHPQQTQWFLMPSAEVRGALMQVSALEYRPHRKGMLAVASDSAVCLWEFSQPNASPATLNCRVLKTRSRTQLGGLAWSPDGRLLAAAHADSAGFTVWDTALGAPTKLSTGLSSTTILRWSPNGSYLFVASPRGKFDIWETENWRNAGWHMPANGDVISACWSSDSKALLIAYSQSQQLSALYFIGQPSSLQAQILPVDLPEVWQSLEQGGSLRAMDWDSTMERLVIAVTSDHESGSGQLLLYSTAVKPVIKSCYMGSLGSATAHAKHQALRFHRNFKQGALLAVYFSDRKISAIPLMFTPQQN